ncbi:MAG: hypothetical protein ACOCTG_03980 [Bacteroidota bacterium]
MSLAIRFLLLLPLFIVLFIVGAVPMEGVMPPESASEPGLLAPGAGLLVYALANVAVVAALIMTSRWCGWKLALGLSVAYYGSVTFMTQIETWYFLSDLTVAPELLPLLFVMGIPPAFIFIPAAVWLLGWWQTKGRSSAKLAAGLPPTQWVVKFAVISVVYLALYWLAGYFIAWQNPDLRAFYGSPGPATPFLEHTARSVGEDPWLFPFQLLRGVMWAGFALIVIRGSRVGPWPTALVVALLLSVPQNVGHVLANPLLPQASVRLSHMIETASSMFVFGLLVTGLLHRRHRSIADLFGGRVGPAPTPGEASG